MDYGLFLVQQILYKGCVSKYIMELKRLLQSHKESNFINVLMSEDFTIPNIEVTEVEKGIQESPHTTRT